MRKILLSMTPAVLLAAALLASCATTRETGAFIRKDGMPDAKVFLPAPPQPGSGLFYADSCQYEWGKTVRPTPRGTQAAEDAAISASYYARIFSEPFGYSISAQETPEIYNLIRRTIPTVRQSISDAKRVFARPRPFVYFNEPPFLPSDDKDLRHTYSYPSGHTIRGWAIALVLAEVNPSAQDALLVRGYEYGQSRVILGVHYQSDVDAARLAAGACVARMNEDKEFRTQLARAVREFERLQKKAK